MKSAVNITIIELPTPLSCILSLLKKIRKTCVFELFELCLYLVCVPTLPFLISTQLKGAGVVISSNSPFSEGQALQRYPLNFYLTLNVRDILVFLA